MHRRILPVLAAVLLVLGLGTGPALARPATASADEPVAYLALGDSYGAGYQPGTGHDLDGGYAGTVLDAFAELAPGAQLTNLSCSGETIESYLEGGRFCSYEGSQRDAALAFLAEHPETRLITIDLGGNNVQTCVTRSGSVDLACVQQGLATIRAELPGLLGELREAAPEAQLVLTNYPDVFLAAWLTGPSGQDLARLSLTLVNALNTIFEDAATAAGADFADVSDAFRTNDFTLVDDPAYGEIPTNVAMICSLTWMCVEQDIHPNDEGYAVIASVIVEALRAPAGPTSPAPSSTSSAPVETPTVPTPTVPSSTVPSTTAPVEDPSAGGPRTPDLVQTDGRATGAGPLPGVLALVTLGGVLVGVGAARRRGAARH